MKKFKEEKHKNGWKWNDEYRQSNRGFELYYKNKFQLIKNYKF